MSTIARLILVALTAIAAVTRSAAQHSDLTYEKTKSLVYQLADTRGPNEVLIRERDALIARGPQATELLTQVLKVAPEDKRTAVLFLLSDSVGDKSQAISFIESLLAGEPREWAGKDWLMGALLVLRTSAPEKARLAYLRILDVDNNRDDQLVALTMLKRYGKQEDLPRLERLVESRTGAALVDGELVDGIAYMAGEAIKAISERASASAETSTAPSPPASPNEAHSENATQPPQNGNEASHAQVTRDAGASTRMWWGIGACLISLALVIIWLKRR